MRNRGFTAPSEKQRERPLSRSSSESVAKVLPRAFTLIELLVVIAIIGILSSVILASLNSARNKANDARRLSDVHQLATAVFLAADKNNGTFPSTGGEAKCLGTSGTCWGGTVTGSATLLTAVQEFMPTIPKDPQTSRARGDRYLYADATSVTAYQCTGVTPTGPFIIWIPEVADASDANAPLTASQCKSPAFFACQGAAPGYFCAFKIQ